MKRTKEAHLRKQPMADKTNEPADQQVAMLVSGLLWPLIAPEISSRDNNPSPLTTVCI